ncbi:MAG: c-type cytochrome, partial [Planctomycetaceae bacterium]
MWRFRVWRSKLILLLTSLVFLQCLVLAAIDEHATEWRDHQKQYARELADKAREAGRPVVEFPIEIRQSYLENLDLKRVDRCTSCHVGIENPQFTTVAQPLKTHPGDLLKHHPSDKFGCTICHQGQGRATTKDAAHGHVRFWDEPLLTGDFVQASCAKCHHDDPIPQTPVLTRGRKLMRSLGCVGCHQAGEIVAEDKVGPRLDAIGSKVSRTWLNKWLLNSHTYLPQGKMPHYGLTPPAADAL